MELLEDKNVYLDILQNSIKRIDKEYLLCFILDPTEEKKELIKRVSLKLKLEVICLVDLTDARKKAEKFKEYENYPYADIEEFLYLFKNAKFIITDSYIMDKEGEILANGRIKYIKMDTQKIQEGVEVHEEMPYLVEDGRTEIEGPFFDNL